MRAFYSLRFNIGLPDWVHEEDSRCGCNVEAVGGLLEVHEHDAEVGGCVEGMDVCVFEFGGKGAGVDKVWDREEVEGLGGIEGDIVEVVEDQGLFVRVQSDEAGEEVGEF